MPMYTLEEMQAVARLAQDIAHVVSQTGRLRATVPVGSAVAVMPGEEDEEAGPALVVTFNWANGRWVLSEIERT